ncbi:MAG: leucine--tRNA ligase [Pleurocapsa minor GSE-CHR-MK-17-07R]|jgi:leucyl-tRNA synthetase|nr:leucine--tRNA ligase [Pleurocapsa minor GSE-CHR-MK 17-07R]
MADRERYSPAAIEKKWQQQWENTALYRSKVDWSKPKHYALTMLPYPSGDLHIGHWFAMTPSDARARWMRMRGYNVLFPMGFDAFGLPAENAAVQRGIHPAEWTFGNIERMRGQLRTMGAMFDWSREMVSCEPSYYKWTEWFFKIFYENNLAYRGEAMVNWSDALQTVLANEQVIDGKDERLGQPVVQKLMTQWFFRYRAYADEMLDFSMLDWPDKVRAMQTNWIGRSEGARVTFHVENGPAFDIFTTRPDTLWGVTFMVLAAEHPLVDKITTPEQRAAVTEYVAYAASQTEIERTAEGKEKTGVFTGAYAINPVNKARVPIWIADYVMITYGTGAIMAVPSGDQRDFEFARKFGIEIIPVIQPEGVDPLDGATMTEAYAGAGVMVNSAQFNGTASNGEKGRKNPAISAVIDWLEAQGIGKEEVNYRLRDWLISRQRYWGSPIPVLFTEDGQIETVPLENLPVVLPTDIKFLGVMGNALNHSESFLNVTDSKGRPARRETDTMDTFMCSSWYHLRYLSPKYEAAPFDPEEAAYWLPVDVYTGGAEHATMHLLYTRWFNKAIRDQGVFDDAAKIMAAHGRDAETAFDEPMLLLRNQGQVLGAERKGDVIIATGRREGAKLLATTIEVASTEDARAWEKLAAAGQSPFPQDTSRVVGEMVKRTENLLTIVDMTNGLALTPVEVQDGASVTIPSIPGPNTVNQLKHHLEIQRMSKSKGNVVNPDALVEQYGADTVRAYLMFGFDWELGGPWNDQNIQGVVRWLNDVWELVTTGPGDGESDAETARQAERKLHQAIRRVDESLESFSFNTAVSALMTLKNELRGLARDGKLKGAAWYEAVRGMLLLMAPITPHIAEELWAEIGGAYSVHTQDWPQYDADKAAEAETTLVVMRNGKPVDRVLVPADIGESDAIAAALASAGIQRSLNGAEPKRVIFIPGRGGGAVGAEPKVNVVL